MTKIESDQTQKQALELCKALLLANSGAELDGIQAQRLMIDKYGFYADHHLWTDVMDHMTRTGGAVCIQPTGYTKYRIGVKQ